MLLIIIYLNKLSFKIKCLGHEGWVFHHSKHVFASFIKETLWYNWNMFWTISRNNIIYILNFQLMKNNVVNDHFIFMIYWHLFMWSHWVKKHNYTYIMVLLSKGQNLPQNKSTYVNTCCISMNQISPTIGQYSRSGFVHIVKQSSIFFYKVKLC